MKTFLIIGGNSGMGEETAKKLISEGHRVIAALRKPEHMEIEGVEKQSFNALEPTPLDLPETLDGFVYFPGSINLKPFNGLKEEDFNTDYQINAKGAVYALQQALPSLKNAESASVVLYSTVAVQTGMPYHASIAMAKGAVEGLTRSLAAEWAPKIRVNAIAPSLTDTPLASNLLNTESKREASEKRHPLNRVGHAEEFATLTAFLLGDGSRFMTGQVVSADGGISSVKTF